MTAATRRGLWVFGLFALAVAVPALGARHDFRAPLWLTFLSLAAAGFLALRRRDDLAALCNYGRPAWLRLSPARSRLVVSVWGVCVCGAGGLGLMCSVLSAVR